MWRGPQGKGAEIGHMTILGEGPKCACGSRGCLDTLASSGALLQRAQLEMKKDPSSSLHSVGPLMPKAIAQAAREGDDVAIAVLAETGYYLGIGLANVANIFNPEMIVLAGGLSRAGEALIRPAEKEMRKRAFEAVTEDLELKESELGRPGRSFGSRLPYCQRDRTKLLMLTIKNRVPVTIPKIKIVFGLMLLLFTSLGGDAWAELPFQVGERLVFDIRWAGIHAGTAELPSRRRWSTEAVPSSG